MSGAEHNTVHEQNTVQIESTRIGDKVKFNDLKRPATVTNISEEQTQKVITIKGERTGKYKLKYHRDTGVIDFKRTSQNKRRIILHQFIVVNRQPRPFHDYDMTNNPNSVTIDAETGYWILKLYRDSFIHDGTQYTGLTDENKETYRNSVVLTFQLASADTQFEFVGPEVDLLETAFEWALKTIDFTDSEKKQLIPIYNNICDDNSIHAV